MLKIGTIEIPDKPRYDGEYTLKCLGSMYKRNYEAGNKAKCVELYDNMVKLNKHVKEALATSPVLQYQINYKKQEPVGFDEENNTPILD